MLQFTQGDWVKIVSDDPSVNHVPEKDRKAFVVRVNEDGTARLLTNKGKIYLDNVQSEFCDKIEKPIR